MRMIEGGRRGVDPIRRGRGNCWKDDGTMDCLVRVGAGADHRASWACRDHVNFTCFIFIVMAR